MENKRRFSDTAPASIEKMILNENDPEKRAIFVFMQHLNDAIAFNAVQTNRAASEHTAKLSELSEKLDAHLASYEKHSKAEEGMLNRGKGMWMVLSVVLVLAQAGFGYVWIQMQKELEGIHADISASKVTDVRIEGEFESLEHRLHDHLKTPEPPSMGLHK